MKLFITFDGAEQEVRFVVLVEPKSTVASLRQRILTDFRLVFPSRLPLCFFRMATADGFFLTDGATVGEVLDDGSTVTCHRADAEVMGAPLSEDPSAEEVNGLFQTFTSQVSYVAKAVCHAATVGSEVSEAMPILLAMLMLRGPKLLQVRTAALDALQCSLPLASGARSLSAFLAAGGLFVLLSMLSPSTKQGSEAEVERAAELFEDLLAQHGDVLGPLLEECEPSSLLQKLARDSRSSTKTKQHALAGRRALERPAEPMTGLPGPRPPKAPGMDTRRLQSAGAQAVGGYSPSGRLSRTSSRLLPGGMTLRLLLDERRPDQGSETMLSALAEYEAKVTHASEVALCELASDSGAAELAAVGLKRQRSYLSHLNVILGRFAGHPKAKSIFAQLLSKYLRLCDALEALPSCWPYVPATMRPAVLELLEEAFHSSQATSSDARALLASLQDSSVPMELQAFVLQLLRKVLDPGRKAHSVALSPKAVNGALMAAMPKHPLLCLEVLGTSALKEDFRVYLANQQSLTKFLVHCCLQPESCKGSDALAIQRAASRCLANLGVSSGRSANLEVIGLKGLYGSTEDFTVRAYLGIALGIEQP